MGQHPVESELVALVNRSGAVVGSADRARVRRENLMHAATGILVRDEGGRIYVHRRSPDKDWAPSHHDAAAGGVLTVGEDPSASAERTGSSPTVSTPPAAASWCPGAQSLSGERRCT